jgi:hypothetical protein
LIIYLVWTNVDFWELGLTQISVHRYSLPSNNFNSPYRPNLGGVDSFAAAKHLFNRDDENHAGFNAEHRLSTPDIQSYMKMTEPDDKFPTLSRRDGSNIVSFHNVQFNIYLKIF